MTREGSIVLVAYGGGHAAMLIPVAQELMGRGHSVRFLALTTAAQQARQAGIEPLGYRDLPGADSDEVRRWGGELAAGLESGGVVDEAETIAYLGLNYCELIAEHGEETAAEMYRADGRQIFRPTALFERWLADVRPALVVATNSPRSERAAILAAGRLGIPSVCAVDLFALQEVLWVGEPGYADRVCVLNDEVRDMFVEYGRDPEEVVVTGNPAFDRLAESTVVAEGQALRSARGWDDGRVTVLWASQPEPAHHPMAAKAGDPHLPRRIERELRSIVRARPDVRLVVRYHPSEQVSFEPAEDVTLSASSEPLEPLLHAVDVVVVTASTVGLQASLVGRPVLSVDCSMWTEYAPYSQMGISTGVESPEALPSALDELIATTEFDRVHVPSAAASGTATERVVAVIESLLPSSLREVPS